MIEKLTDIEGIAEYLKRVDAEPRSLFSAVILKREGRYWADKATIRFSKDGIIKASHDDYSPTEEEQNAILEGFKKVQIPEYRKLATLPKKGEKFVGALTPRLEKGMDEDRIFVFKDQEGEILMLQERVEQEDGQKIYLPWTFWSDNRWRLAEGTEKMPLFGLEEINNYGILHIHEGAKAARNMQRLRDGESFKSSLENERLLADHPWSEDLKHVGHLAWCSGAPSPGRTDWLPVRNTQQVFLIADNDGLGKDAIPKITQHLRGQIFYVQFTNEFPISFDMGDEFPDNLFVTGASEERYFQGPHFHECLHPATWATDVYENNKGRPSYKLRPAFRDSWTWVADANLFVHKVMPWIIVEDKKLNRLTAAYSNVGNVADLLVKTLRDRIFRMCYRPDSEHLIITNQGASAINVHVPSRIQPLPEESVDPWIEFMEYMIPNEKERHEVYRWVATLIHCPQVRIGYGLLMISETQGIGKSLLGAGILSPLVGRDNTSFPGEADIVSEFNAWIAQKRLAVIHEVYAGHSKKTYTMLKSAITDPEVTVNRKYIAQYTIENWCHLYACSNSFRALKMDDDDRRWYYPVIQETKWSKDKFIQFRRWLHTVGLGAIKAWAKDFGDYVDASEHAPMTKRKMEMIQEGQNPIIKEAKRLAHCIANWSEPIVISSRDVERWANEGKKTLYPEPFRTLKMAMLKECETLQEWPERLWFDGEKQTVLLNEKALEKVEEEGGKVLKIAQKKREKQTLRELRKMPHEIIEVTL